MNVDALRSKNTSYANDLYRKINVSDDQVKRHYFGMEFNKINHPEFYDEANYPLSWMPKYGRTSVYVPQINNISFMMPYFPPLFKWDQLPKSLLCNHLNRSTACPNDAKYCSCIYTLEFNLGDVVEFVIVDEGFTFQSNHPMHLHGASFAVLGVQRVSMRH